MGHHHNLSTAHRIWDERWSEPSSRASWTTPEGAVVEAAASMRERGVRSVLDLGCGVGRHALYLASEGFQVAGLDASPAGIAATRHAARDAGLPVDLSLGTFTDLPFRDGAFDAVLAWNVIYHGDGNAARHAIGEIVRTLAPGGLFQGTMISKRHFRYGHGREIRPDTFVNDEDQEKAHPHFYCDSHGVMALLREFEIIRLEDRVQREPDSYHFEFLAERRATRRPASSIAASRLKE